MVKLCRSMIRHFTRSRHEFSYLFWSGQSEGGKEGKSLVSQKEVMKQSKKLREDGRHPIKNGRVAMDLHRLFTPPAGLALRGAVS